MDVFFRKFLSPPIFVEDEEKTRSARVLNTLLLGTILILSIFIIVRIVTEAQALTTITTIVLTGLDLVCVGMLFLMKRGSVRQAGFLYILLGWIGLTFQAWTYSGLRDVAVIAYIVIILAASLIAGLRTSIGFTALSLLTTWFLAYRETIGIYNGAGDLPYPSATQLTIIFILAGLISYIAVNNINQALKASRASEQELKKNNKELQALQSDLEKRVSERTNDLERRSSEIQTASLIARDTATAPDVDSLIDRAAQLIRDKFGYYHTGIYLVDDNGEYAVMRAAGGDAGNLMMKRKYKVKVGEIGIIGYVAQTGSARIVLDVTNEPAYQKNPLLPYTRSEMALPLKVTNRIIGVLDIQSDKINAFDHNSISIMQIVTDQISISIERSQLLQGLQQNAAALQQALQENTSRSWRNFLEQNQGFMGYQYDGTTMEPMSKPSRKNLNESAESLNAASAKGEPTQTGNIVEVPIRLRGQTLGSLKLQFRSAEIPPETMRLVQETANRLALALENARLVIDAQRLAVRERQINVISAQAQQSTNLDTLLQNTVRELGNTLGLPKTFIQIGLVHSDNKEDQ